MRGFLSWWVSPMGAVTKEVQHFEGAQRERVGMEAVLI